MRILKIQIGNPRIQEKRIPISEKPCAYQNALSIDQRCGNRQQFLLQPFPPN
ncbi:hypothetical protein HanIR_Chr09g0438721 [Helianthus annuus]|nr:hypothetical protein HanIR_Chr09g0438721 [Helianthus annuus]